MRACAKTEMAITNVLNKYTEAYSKKDIKGVLSLLTQDPDMTFVGTDVNEKCTGPNQLRKLIERDFNIVDDLSWKWGEEPLISMAGNVAWVTTDCSVRVTIQGEPLDLPLRITAVMENRNNKWLIAQWHNSVPVIREL